MSDMLLSIEKQNKFERMIERAITEEFNESVDVLVKSDGSVFVWKEDSDIEASESVVSNKSDVFSVLSDIDFECQASEYQLVSDESVVGCSFELERAGW